MNKMRSKEALLLLVACLLCLAPRMNVAAPVPPDSDEKKCFLFTYFVGNGEDGLHLASSHDGRTWEALKGGRSFLAPQVGESRLMRDPCAIRGPDGNFHMVWTTAWNGQTIGHASTKDFVHWSPQQAIPVMAHEPAVRNCWAPEVFWDPVNARYLIFWASTVTNKFLETAGASEDRYNHRMYSTTTKDFKRFTPTSIFYDPGFSVIDATLLQASNKFYLIIKDETVKPPKKHLRIATADTPEGPFRDLGKPFTRDWVEGPTSLRVGSEFLVYFDAYRDHRYEAVSSLDLETWKDITPETRFPRGARHGSALSISCGLLEKLKQQQ